MQAVQLWNTQLLKMSNKTTGETIHLCITKKKVVTPFFKEWFVCLKIISIKMIDRWQIKVKSIGSVMLKVALSRDICFHLSSLRGGWLKINTRFILLWNIFILMGVVYIKMSQIHPQHMKARCMVWWCWKSCKSRVILFPSHFFLTLVLATHQWVLAYHTTVNKPGRS